MMNYSASTLQAVNESLEHWRQNIAAENFHDVSISADDCALCEKFLKIHGCGGCPIKGKTGQNTCKGTPYTDVQRTWRKWGDEPSSISRREAFRTDARKMWWFIFELRAEIMAAQVKEVRGEPALDLDLPLYTKSGLRVYLARRDRAGPYPLQGIVAHQDARDVAETWTADGHYQDIKIRDAIGHPLDLTNAVPEKLVLPLKQEPRRIKGYINIYINDSFLHKTRKEADSIASGDRAACLEIDLPFGHGLEGFQLKKS